MSSSSKADQVKASKQKRVGRQLSCSLCRSGKLKCDRETPHCNQCIKRSRQSLCVYSQNSSNGKVGSKPSHEIFDWFGLSRELRDLIYAHMINPMWEQPRLFGEGDELHGDSFEITTNRAIPTNMLLVGRQFCSELEERADAICRVYMLDMMEDWEAEEFDSYRLSLAVKLLAYAEFHVWSKSIGCEAAQGEMAECEHNSMYAQLERMEYILQQMPNIKEATLTVTIQDESSCTKNCRAALQKCLRSLKNSENSKVPHLCWTRVDRDKGHSPNGWQQWKARPNGAKDAEVLKDDEKS
ncbi:hypothetical protein LTR17_012370 [Elasticomyces elasticus]|nr:hypothetical protein LTR17_012370 [Elasticomyces elasticus]